MKSQIFWTQDKEMLSLYRKLLVIAASVYMAWWFAIQMLLPQSFNPFPSRLLVSALPLSFFTLSYLSRLIESRIRGLFILSVWLMTIHYFYLFYGNAGEINWIIGCYITVIAITLTLYSTAALLSYSIFVLILSLLLTYFIPSLRESVFLPGLITILGQANLGLRSQQKIIRDLNQSNEKVEKEKRVTQTLAENIRARDEFISVASHELKTPLTSLKLQAQITARGIQSKNPQVYSVERVDEFVTFVSRQIDRLTQLVEAMLDVSRISAGKLTLEFKKIDLVHLVKEIVALLSIQSGESGSKITVETPDQLWIHADSHRIEQVIENLVSNAIKYGNKKPIQVQVSQDQENAIVIVQDNGMGIEPDCFERIFERFERATSSKNISGLGLGLYICRQILDAHGGSVSVESEIGKGSKFTVRLKMS